MRIKLDRTEKKWEFCVFFLAFMFDTPASRFFPESMFSIPRIILMLVVILIFCLKKVRGRVKAKTINPTFITFFLFIFYYYLLSAIIHGITFQVSVPISYISLALLCILCNKRNKHAMYKGLSDYFIAVLIAQTLLQLVSPNGINVTNIHYWIFDNRNYPIRFFLPGACFTVLLSVTENSKILSFRTILYLVLFSYVILPSGSGTGILTLGSFIILLFFFTKRKWRFLSIKWMMCFSIIIFIAIIMFSIQTHFGTLLSYLGKDLTFSGRSVAWSRAISILKSNLLFGIGTYSDLSSFVLFSHCHQFWVQQMVTGGLIGTIITVILFTTTDKALRGNTSLEARIYEICLICFLIAGIDEALTQSLFLYPLCVSASDYVLTRQNERTRLQTMLVRNLKEENRE